MEGGVGDRNEETTRAEHAGELGQRAGEIGHVVEHPRSYDGVERPVGERKRLDVRDASIEPALARELDHARRKIRGDHLRVRLVGDPLGELAPSAADLQHTPRLDRAHGVDGRPACVTRGGSHAGEDRRPCAQS